MAQLRRDYQQFVERGAEIMAVGPESQERFQAYWREHEMPFVGLPDPEHIVARLYRQEVNLLKLGRMPAQLVVDRAGRIRYQYYGRSMSDISPNELLLRALDASTARNSLCDACQGVVRASRCVVLSCKVTGAGKTTPRHWLARQTAPHRIDAIQWRRTGQSAPR